MSKISIVVEVDAIPLSSVLGEAYRKYYFYEGRVYSTQRRRTATPIGYKTPNGTDVVRLVLSHPDPRHPRRYLRERVFFKISVIQQKVNEFKEGK